MESISLTVPVNAEQIQATFEDDIFLRHPGWQ
jgi:hypothetical protein